MSMFKIENSVTSILLSYVEKYVQDFNPANAQVSLWGGGIILHNLVLKPDVVQQEVPLPFTLLSGRIHQLLIQVPWTKIISEPIVVTINTMECILSLNPPDGRPPPSEAQRGNSLVMKPPGYMEALIRRVVSNISVRLNSLIIKYVQDDIVLSINVKKLSIDSVGVNWEPLFADIDPFDPAIRRTVRIDDLTLCLDRTDSDGKIRFYYEPLLFHCQMELRVLTKLVSANTRQARSVCIELTCGCLAWVLNGEQLMILLQLLADRSSCEMPKPNPPSVPTENPNPPIVQPPPMDGASSNLEESTNGESWSDWAWSWMPTLNREGINEPTLPPLPPAPVPVSFTAYFHDVSVMFKITETDGFGRKRTRVILELSGTSAVIKSYICAPTISRFSFGIRDIFFGADGKCVCGICSNALHDETRVYLQRIKLQDEEPWCWEHEKLNRQVNENAEVIDESYREFPEETYAQAENLGNTNREDDARAKEELLDDFWKRMNPVIYLEHNHERTPADQYQNPYDNPPSDFEYSDWVEDSDMQIRLQPMLCSISTGLFHRIAVIKNICKRYFESKKPSVEIRMRQLTVEERDALKHNLPQRHAKIEINGFRLRLIPANHSLNEVPILPPLIIDLEVPRANVTITAPLYPHRVCSAACQVNRESKLLQQASRLHMSFDSTINVGIRALDEETPRPIVSANTRIILHSLLNKKFFEHKEATQVGVTFKIRELNVCGTMARLQAAHQVLQSLRDENYTDHLRNTTLVNDALHDEDYVGIDITIEELLFRKFITKNINTHFLTLDSIKVTAFHLPAGGESRRVWIFSAPETQTTKPYIKASWQWCLSPIADDDMEFLNLSVKPTALSIDPMLVKWLSYRSKLKPMPQTESIPKIQSIKNVSSSQYLSRRRVTPPSSSGQGGSRSGSGAELVHIRPRSLESSSEKSEKKEPKPPPQENQASDAWWKGDNLVILHERLKSLLIGAEIGLIQIYISSTSVSAFDCGTIREAMERHITTAHRVLVLSVGSLYLESNPQWQDCWVNVNFDRPTYLKSSLDTKVKDNGFPWRASVSDMSCYTLQVRPGTERSGKEKSMSGLRSQLKPSRVLVPQTVLEPVTTAITVSVDTKTLVIKTRKCDPKPKRHDRSRDEDKTKYFMTGSDFKPTSLKEFVRGPAKQIKHSSEPGPSEPYPDPLPDQASKYTTGPLISLGFNVHAKTPPIIVRLDQDQVQTVAIAMHCFTHIMSLLRRPPVTTKKRESSFGGTIERSISELDERPSESEETASENPSEQLISIFEASDPYAPDEQLTTFLWYKWDVSHAALVISSSHVKLEFDLDDIVSTVDVKYDYTQIKLKIASGSVRHYRCSSNEWYPGVLGGRIVEARDPIDDKDKHFFKITITQALISSLPESWKDEFHPKLIEQNAINNVTSVWEVYGRLVPLEVVLQPNILDHMISFLHELTLHAPCALQSREMKREAWQWPFFHFSAGGLRLLLTTSDEVGTDNDDTMVLLLGKTTVSPHPQNPICRQSVSTSSENNWTTLCPGFDSRQYEVLVRNVAIRTTKFSQLVNQELTESQILKSTSSENPALKWSQQVASPVFTPILHCVDIGCILAPAIFCCGGLASGPAVEINLLSDCSVEVGIQNIELARILIEELLHAYTRRNRGSFMLDEENICPYAPRDGSEEQTELLPTVIEKEKIRERKEVSKRITDINRFGMIDSGVETTTSHSTCRRGRKLIPIKKLVTKPCFDYTANPSDYLEVFVTTGVIDISLYVKDDNSPEVQKLRPPAAVHKRRLLPEPRIRVVIDDKNETRLNYSRVSATTSRSLTETVRNVDIGKTKLDENVTLPLARSTKGNLPLIHVTLYQPNLYYWNRRKQKTVQVSLFNAWIGLGEGQDENQWNVPLLNTKNGTPDSVTDIPPALMTMRADLSIGGYTPVNETSSRGVLQMDIERPLMLEVCTDRFRRIKGILDLIKTNVTMTNAVVEETEETSDPFLYKLRRNLVNQRIECVIIQTNQIGIRGSEGVAGCDSVRMQLAVSERPDVLTCRILITAAVLTAGSTEDRRHVILQPLMAGMLLDASWEAWRQTEEGFTDLRKPTLQVGVDFDKIVFDCRPTDFATAVRIYETIKEILGNVKISSSLDLPASRDSEMATTNEMTEFLNQETSAENDDTNNHFYKDDLRSGAFKLVPGMHTPMAYQATLHGSTLTWRYPQPRAITRIIVYPVPNLKEDDIEYVLELYCPMLVRWEPQTYFVLPIKEQIEMLLNSSPRDAVFATMWRLRACSESDYKLPFHFDARKFMPREDPLSGDTPPANDYSKRSYNVTAKQLVAVLQVDSYFGPLFLPRTRVSLRLASLEIHAHNDNPEISRESSQRLEGYYVSRPLMQNHRMLTLRARDSSMHCLFGRNMKLLLDSHLSSDVIDSANGTMEKFINEFRAQGTLGADNRTRLRVSDIRVALHVARIATLRALVDDWNVVYKKCVLHINENLEPKKYDKNPTEALSGRISLWVHNNCTSVVRISQEDTDELLPISPGASLSYRWNSPGAVKRLRFSLATTSSNWRWSKSIRFTPGSTRVLLEDKNTAEGAGGVYLHVRVKDNGAQRDMYLSGRLLLANVLRYNFAFKLRARPSFNSPWEVLATSDLPAETVGLSVLCDINFDASFKVRFKSNENGWSGEIPLRECNKRNVPWLVKIPTNEEEVEYKSVWCRVTPVKNDAGIVATFWPFYMLRSHLPLNVDVRISSGERLPGMAPVACNYPLTVHMAEGRGSITHLMVPGTTSIRHKLTFQYRDIDCPVTREVVMLHYGMTETSVFENRENLKNIEDVVELINQWLEKSRDASAKWPYSVVTNHWPGAWQPALLQPRCDVNVRYEGIQVGTGCSLQLILSPIVLLANASPISLTLRGHNASPMCRLDPGIALAPPTIMLQKPFFMSIEVDRDIFVSGQMEICSEDPGRYGQPAPGHIALEKPTKFAIQCNQKVAILSLIHEIKDDMNIIGITSSFVLINWLNDEILVSALAVPNELTNQSLRPKAFKIVPPTKKGSLHGTPLCRFWLTDRWRGGNVDELRTFLCVAFPTKTYQASTSVPIKLGVAPVRRSISLKDKHGGSVPIAVTQLRHESRWIVTFSEDPCPQFVLQNRSKITIGIAQPAGTQDKINLSKTVQDCVGVQWWCILEPNTITHYSTPAYCQRYPPPAQEASASTSIITVGVKIGEGIFEWSQPIAVTNGEQLLQLYGGVSMKMRVRTQPHSTPIEFHDVDQTDISPSDIRRRLDMYSTESQLKQQQETQETPSVEFQKVGPNYFKNKTLQDSKNKDDLADQSAEEPKPSTSKQIQHRSGHKSGDSTTTTATSTAVEFYQLRRSESNHEDLPQAYENELLSDTTLTRKDSDDLSETYLLEAVSEKDWSDSSKLWSEKERFRCVIDNVIVSVGAYSDALPLLALHLQRVAVRVQADTRMVKAMVAIADIQLDNVQYDTDQYDFAVVATTRVEARVIEHWPALWGMFNERIPSKAAKARLLLKTCHDRWTVDNRSYQELTEVEVLLGPMGLYIEDECIAAALELYNLAVPSMKKNQSSESIALAQIYTLQRPLILRKLIIYPLDITLTLHTAVRMYIALDESPLRLSTFQLQDAITSFEALTHALTVHYLSAVILGAGWVVGGLELLGAPGALAARVGNAGGGVKGVASTAAGALLRSLSSAAGSFARNLDLLAGDEDHAKRAAAARRRPPPNLMAGLATGITNFAINLLGAVGGIAHHPLVGVAVGESESGAAALRRGLVGAITKPLSATADLVAFAGQGLLSQTGWDPVPQPRATTTFAMERASLPSGWRRDCVRYTFRYADLGVISGFKVLVDDTIYQLVITHKYLLIIEPETEHLCEMIELKRCSLGPYHGEIIELIIAQEPRVPEIIEPEDDDDDDDDENLDVRVSAAAMARVARYTGTKVYEKKETDRVIALLCIPGTEHALRAALCVALHSTVDTHFSQL
ncbi:intermembrane lipid transfer protein VPS13B isoform X2 [Nymphalis io]|uniref:intermembrane lipid transfer protein VPS13B isoform X2 n=1 Tax=Inachis io TaxID=171585 RepID=UPI0021697D70|nr:intermembrane lipid transfer protein VPS13B isoform X2 [Nymphalis io]